MCLVEGDANLAANNRLGSLRGRVTVSIVNARRASLLRLLFVTVFFVALAVFSLRAILFQAGTIGHNWDWSIPSLASYLRFEASNSFFVWNNASLGFPNIFGLPDALFSFVFASFGYVGLSGDFVSKTLAFIPIVFSGIAMFYFSRDIVIGALGSRVPCHIIAFSSVISAVFYALSPYLFADILGGAATQFFTYSIIPVALLTFRRTLISERARKLTLTTALILSVITFSIQNVVLVFVLFFLYSLVTRNRSRNLKRFGLIAAMFVSINLYWILPVIYYSILTGLPVASSYGTINLGVISTGVPSIVEALADTGYAGRPIFTLAIAPGLLMFFWFFAYALISLSLASILLIRKKSHDGLFWSAIFAVSLVLATGTKSPLAGLVVWLYQNFPPMILYRSPQHLLLLTTLSIGVLLALGVSSLLFALGSSPKLRRVVGLVMVLVLLMLTVWVSPFFSGNLGWDSLTGGNYNSVLSHVNTYELPPDYVQVLNNLTNQEGNFRVLFVPPTASPWYLQTEYQWVGQGGDPTVFLSPHPAIYREADEQVSTQVEEMLYGQSAPKNFSEFIGLFSVKYVILRADVKPVFGQYAGQWNYTNVYRNLNRTVGLSLIYHSTYLTVWENSATLPLVYATSQSVRTSVLKPTNAVSSYTMVNPTMYVIQMDISSPQVLVLGEKYDNNWVAYIDGQLIPNGRHFEMNGWSNAWDINETGSHTIVLAFNPQRVFVFASLLSAVSLSLGSMLLIWRKERNES